MILRAVALAALSLAVVAPATAQVAKTEVSHSTSTDNGVRTHTTKVTHVYKHKSRRPRKILGVKIGHKTVVHKVVRKTTVSSNGDHSTMVVRK